jgi:hypothetical protein
MQSPVSCNPAPYFANAEAILPHWPIHWLRRTWLRKGTLMRNPKIATVVFPARHFEASVAAWSSVFGEGPTFSSNAIAKAPDQADFAVFKTADIEIGLTSLPWVDEPLVLLDTTTSRPRANS